MWQQFDFYTILSNASKGLEGALVSLNIMTNPSSVKVATDTEKQSEKSNSTDLNTPRNSSTPSDLNTPRNSSKSSNPEHTQGSISNSSSASSSQNKLSQRTSNHPSHHPDERYGRQASSARRANSMPHSNVPSPTPSAIGAHSPSLQNTYQRAYPHPAGLKPINSLSQQNQPQTTLTGQGARNQVLGMGGIRPTEFQSGDAKKAKERDLENIGIRLAGLEFELSRTEIRKGNLNTVKYHPEFGSYNSRGTKECKNDESEKRLKIKVLKEDLLKNYSLSDIKKVYASKNTELQRLKNTPSVRPSAPLVVTRATSSYLTRY